MAACQLRRSRVSPQGHMPGVTSAHLGAGGSDGSHPAARVGKGSGPALVGRKQASPRSRRPRRAIFRDVFHCSWWGGVLWTNILRPCVPATVPTPQTEPLCLGTVAATLLAAQADPGSSRVSKPF